jgi:lysophospholipase L1-like esterase
MRSLLLSLLATVAFSARVAAADFLPGVTRIVFLGDSITYAGQYVDLFEAFLFTQFPTRSFEVIDCGLPSETVSGLSEIGHAGGKFPRPDLHERLDRVLAKAKPQLIFACYGMNDGIYKPYDDIRARRYQEGLQKLRDKAAKAGAQVIHLTPPVFDSVPISGKVAPAGQESANAPYEGYDDVLTRYSAWLLEQRAAGWRVIDLHTPMKAAIAKARESDVSFTFAKDGVHANADGHALIADTLLTALDAERAAKFRASPPSPELLALIRKRGRLLADAWLKDTGHLRPGTAQNAPPLAEAQTQAAGIERQIREKLSAQ